MELSKKKKFKGAENTLYLFTFYFLPLTWYSIMTSIYLTEQKVLVKSQRNYFEVLLNDKRCIYIPCRNVSQFVIFGNINLPREVISIYSLA